MPRFLCPVLISCLCHFLYNLASAGSCRWHTARSIVFVCIDQPGLILWESGWNASVTTCCRAFSTGPLKFKPVKNVGFNVLAVLGALLHTAFESWYFTVWLKAD
jgi:hypothetical protein